MSQGTVRVSSLSIAGAYFFLAILTLWPVLDLTATVWPFQLGDLQWRYGLFGLMASFLHTPILAIGLAMALAVVRRHPGILRLLSVLCFIGALGLFLVMALFALDVVQLRSVTPQERLASFQAGALFSELKHFTAFVSLVLLGWGGWKTAGNMGGRDRSAEASDLTAEVLRAQKRG